MSDFAVMPYSDYKDICDSVRAKTGGTEALKSGEIKPLIDGIQAGLVGGIGAVKFIDVDIAVDASSATAVTYTVDNLEFVSSVENPMKWNSFSVDDVYIFFITPKEITGTPTGDTTNVYNRTMAIAKGNTNYTEAFNMISYGKLDVGVVNYGIYAPTLNCTAITNGKPTGNMTVKVRHHSTGGYEVLAGTYNIQVWYMTDWDWGHTS